MFVLSLKKSFLIIFQEGDVLELIQVNDIRPGKIPLVNIFFIITIFIIFQVIINFNLFVVLKTNLVVGQTKFASSSTGKFSFHNNQISFQNNK